MEILPGAYSTLPSLSPDVSSCHPGAVFDSFWFPVTGFAGIYTDPFSRAALYLRRGCTFGVCLFRRF